MPNVKFTELPNLANITGNTIVPVVEANVNYTVTSANLKSFVNTGAGNLTATTISATGNIIGSNLVTNTHLWFGQDVPSEYISSDDLAMTFVTNNNTRMIATSGGGLLVDNWVTSQSHRANSLISNTSITANTTISALGNVTGSNLRATANVLYLGSSTSARIERNDTTMTFVTNDTVRMTATATGGTLADNWNTTGSLTAQSITSNSSVTAAGLTISGNANIGILVNYAISRVVNGNTGTSVTPNVAAGLLQTYTCNNNFTLQVPANMNIGQTVDLIFTQDNVGNRIMSTSPSLKFQGGNKTLSTAPNAIDVINIFYDGTNYLCSLSTNYS